MKVVGSQEVCPRLVETFFEKSPQLGLPNRSHRTRADAKVFAPWEFYIRRSVVEMPVTEGHFKNGFFLRTL